MRSSNNPVLKSLSEVRTTNYYGGYQQQAHDPYGQYGAPQQPLQAERPMTVDDVVTNTGITLGIIIALAAANFGIAAFVNVKLSLLLTLIGGIGGLVTVLVSTFGKKYGSKAITLTYAAFEGLFVGGISVALRFHRGEAKRWPAHRGSHHRHPGRIPRHAVRVQDRRRQGHPLV